jgi:hypothetical protein
VPALTVAPSNTPRELTPTEVVQPPDAGKATADAESTPDGPKILESWGSENSTRTGAGSARRNRYRPSRPVTALTTTWPSSA